MPSTFIGTAAWNIPSAYSEFFPSEGSQLEKYSQIFNGVEINTSFYKVHQGKTYLKWKEVTPPDFKFSLKLFKYFTHELKLQLQAEDEALLNEVILGMQELGEKLGVLLVQLPPSAKFDFLTSKKFFTSLRKIFLGEVVLEPRHASWASASALELLAHYQISIAFAHPEVVRVEAKFLSTAYFRMHGEEIYESPYSLEELKVLSEAMSEQQGLKQVWAVFDNTMYGFATDNALALKEIIKKSRA